MISFDYNILLSQYQSRYGGGALPAGGAKAPEPPWRADSKPNELVKAALDGKPILDLRKGSNPLKGAEEDYGELFALYKALDTLKAIAERADAKGVDTIERSMLQRRFKTGMGQVETYLNGLKLDKLKLVRGDVSEKLKTGVAGDRDVGEYMTGVVHRGDWSSPVAAFQGPVQFSMKVDRTANGAVIGTTTVNFDLAEMGGATRSIGAVVNYMNSKLQAAGVATRFAREKLPNEPRTVQVGGKPVTLPAGPDQWALKIKGDTAETLTFNAAASAEAVYMARSVGKVDPTNPASQSRELLKIQTDVVTGAPPTAYRPPNEAQYIEGQVFKKALDSDVSAVRASATHTDGSVYMLAEVGGEVEGQPIKGERDVQLLKYDSAGNLVFARTLGAADEANATAIAVAADGKVAIGGSVKGGLLGLGALETPLSPQGADSFVTVFDAEGQELWTKRRGAYNDDEVKALTFAADGTLFVAGQARGLMPGTTTVAGATGGGTADAWLRAYGPTTTTRQLDGTMKTDAALRFTTRYGSTGTDAPKALAMDGTALVAAGVENGRAVMRRFTFNVAGTTATLAATRDLGDLAGGDITAIKVVPSKPAKPNKPPKANGQPELQIVGTTRNGAMNSGAVNRAFGGGRDVFVANIRADLAANNGVDAITYYGGAGEDRLTSAAFGANNEVYLAGTSNAAIAGLPKVGASDGFLVRMDPTDGTVGFSRRFTGKDGDVAPSSIAVAATGASVLDRFGLPKGTIDYTGSKLVTAISSARAGDRMYVKVGEGRRVAVTLAADDTLKTLATKINRAVGFYGKAEVVKDAIPAGGTQALTERIQITAKTSGRPITVEAAEGSRDLLESLGLEEGIARLVERDRKGVEIAPKGGKTYGLKLARDLAIDTKPHIKRSVDELNTAMNTIRTAYRDLADALNPKKPDMGGQVPAYLQAQIKNYQDGLDRLLGGG
ncbi:MAG TPA: hypothetical protein VF699_08335 [Caulobacteraceae bacterium]